MISIKSNEMKAEFLKCAYIGRELVHRNILIRSLESCRYKPNVKISKYLSLFFLHHHTEISTSIISIIKVLHLDCLRI